MRGKFAMESVASFAWNQWQLSSGTGGNFRAEYASKARCLRDALNIGICTLEEMTED
jgi:hypothetical protein